VTASHSWQEEDEETAERPLSEKAQGDAVAFNLVPDDGSNGTGDSGGDCKTALKRKRSPSTCSNSSSSSSGIAEPPRKKQAAATKALPSDDADSLWNACARGDANKVAAIVQALATDDKLSVERPKDGRTPLEIAVKNGHVEVIAFTIFTPRSFCFSDDFKILIIVHRYEAYCH
jgi:hypothetical protein